MKLFTVMAATAIALATPALAADSTSLEVKHSVKKDTDGNVKESYEKTKIDAAGTKTESKVDAQVDVDKSGNVEKTVKTEEVTDPKGLMNKTKVTTKEVTKNHNGKIETSSKKVVNGETVEDKSSTTATTSASTK